MEPHIKLRFHFYFATKDRYASLGKSSLKSTFTEASSKELALGASVEKPGFTMLQETNNDEIASSEELIKLPDVSKTFR